MSANNYIRIKKVIRNRYQISECDADTREPYSKPRYAKNLEEALRIAIEMEVEAHKEGYEIEYGIAME